MITDRVADLLTRIRNALRAGKEQCVVPSSRLARQILDVLVREGYLYGYEGREVRKGIREEVVALKYVGGSPVVDTIARVSRPGRRQYSQIRSVPRVNNGLGILIMSTSKGVLSDREAHDQRVGGEVLCRVC